MKNTKRVPKRRFKEFLGADAWEQRKLGDLAESFVYGLNAPATKFDGINKYIRITDIDDISHLFSKNDLTSPKIDFKTSNNYILKENDILFARTGASVGKTYKYRMVDGKVYFAGFLIKAKIKSEFDSEFVFQNTLTNRYIQFIKLTSQRSGQPGVNAQEYGDFELKVPKKLEQKMIGLFLYKIDNLITLHQRKYDKLKALKSAYLSEMFPQEGEKVPKRRFSGFTDDWEQRKVELLCSISTGKSNTQDKIEGGRYPFYVRSPIIEHSNKYLYDEEAVLTVGDGVGTGKVFHYVNGKYDLHQRVYRMFGFENNILAKFFYYYFSWHFYERVMAMTAKTSVDSVRYEMIGNMEILYPSIEEQNKIVAVFSNLDNLITLHQRKLEKLRNLKAAYLQEMFV